MIAFSYHTSSRQLGITDDIIQQKNVSTIASQGGNR